LGRRGRIGSGDGMPCYYFHLRTTAGLQRDEEGLELPGLEAAYLVSVRQQIEESE